ncbi:AAA family ATPase [Nonomuraea angiospora]|uniref:DNA-binding CsgD family transcriptional regulator n=1 Tax=Nonomuraea angiospora TaxID=46172 RepID=A0ABR9LPY5_9ACTN|nr:helix-turn-helix transcriptional regulator [Nonomuraea angiospora]MBE1582146.1 DNA-binding CsgD family transcriptional regulator [Nonomuraea angiospora]
MLFGRSAEIAAIDDVISRAREGAGAALVLRGEAGVGKTALLDLAASRGGSMRVLRTTGVEPESDLAFAALHQLLRPVAGLLDALPGPQREAVRGALGLGGGASGDRFLLAAGVLSLLAEAAAPDGLVCVVDDFQWVDRASADALLFAARRLPTERIALLLAVRGDAPVKGVPPLRLGGLPEPAAAELLDGLLEPAAVEPLGGLLEPAAAELLDAAMPPAVKRELVAATGGNPLALREIVRRLGPGQLAGREPLPDPLPGGTRLFGEQVAALPDDARLVALLAAVESDLDLVLRAAARMGAGRAALHELEVAGLVRVEGASVRFRHPLIRSAVHEAAAPASRRAAHEALAALSEGDRRAWHLAAAALGQDESVAAALAETAARARDRGGYGDAATALARAAELTPAPRTRAVRLKDAATAAWLGGRPGQAESLLAEARDHAGGDRALEMEIAQLRGRFELNSGSAAEAVRILAAGDSLDMLADAAEAASYVGDTAAIAELGRRAAAFPEGFLRDVLAGIGLMLSDGTGHELLRRALDRTGELTEAAGFLWATAAASYLGEADLAAELAARAGRVARVSGMVGQLPVVLEFVATGERIAGRLAESQALSEEGLELAREAGYANTVAAHLANLAVLAALRGEEETCRGHAQEALAIAIPHRVGLRAGVAAYALAMLDLGAGRFAAAHDRFTAIVAAGPGAGHPTVVWRSTPDRIEAAVGAGDLEAARAALEAYERWSAQAGTAESRALLTRCRALVGAGPEKELPEKELEEALRLHANPYEAARTGLLLGERLRRAHRPGEARPHLRAALETFRRAGAEPWARRAHGELRAAGESAEPARGPALDALTPQELRIAGLVADGLSSKEIAAQLFLSPRTVEYHLYKIYPKLGIGTRTELARLVVLQKAPVAGGGML